MNEVKKLFSKILKADPAVDLYIKMACDKPLIHNYISLKVIKFYAEDYYNNNYWTESRPNKCDIYLHIDEIKTIVKILSLFIPEITTDSYINAIEAGLNLKVNILR